MSWNVWNRPSGSFMFDMGISSNIMKSPFPKCYMTFWAWPCKMTPSIDQTLHQFENLLPNWTLLPILTLLPNLGGFHRTLQRVRLANRGRLLLRTTGPVPFGTSICSNVETILSWTCHVYGPFEFRTSLGTSILLITFVTLFFIFTDTETSLNAMDKFYLIEFDVDVLSRLIPIPSISLFLFDKEWCQI